MVSPLVLVLPEESDETNPKQILKRVKLLDVDMKKAKVRALVLRWFTPTTRHHAMKTTLRLETPHDRSPSGGALSAAIDLCTEQTTCRNLRRAGPSRRRPVPPVLA